jgi:hypothetical protein
VTEIDSPTSRTCQMGFRILGQRSPWASARTASKMAQAAVFSSVPRAASNDSLFGGTSISIAGPAPSGAAIAARGRGAGRHVRVPCPVECPHAYAPPRGPAPPPPFLCRGRTLVTRHPHSGSARRVASAGAGRRRGPRRSQARRSTHGCEVVSFHCETAVARHQTRVRLGFTRVQIETPFQLCPKSPAPNRDALTAI